MPRGQPKGSFYGTRYEGKRKRGPNGKPLNKHGEEFDVGRPMEAFATEEQKEQLLKCASFGMTHDELAIFFNVHKNMFTDRPELTKIIHEGWNNMRMSLRRAQLEKALVKKDTGMLIWLGKNILRQKNDPDVHEQRMSIIVSDERKKIEQIQDEQLLNQLEYIEGQIDDDGGKTEE